MSDEKKLITLNVVVEAGKLDTETGKLVDENPALLKSLCEQVIRELSVCQTKLKTLEEKAQPTVEEKL